ncbi:MAG: Crp/Fnr family transcriptional regulator [Dehalobacterium sp.]
MESFTRKGPFIYSHEETFLPIFTDNLHQCILLRKGEIFLPYINETMIGYIKKGILKVTLSNDEGEERLMWFLEENCIISTFSKLFSQKTIALKPTEILLMNRERFFDIISTNRRFFDLFISQIYQKYEYCIDNLLVQDKKTSKIKVYTLLQQLGKLYGTIQPDKSIYVKNFLTRSEMSSITGVHRSNIIKYITELEQMGIIDKEKKAIVIKQPQLLDTLIQTNDDSDA